MIVKKMTKYNNKQTNMMKTTYIIRREMTRISRRIRRRRRI